MLVPYNCPNCGGTLWEVKSRDVQRFRCHTGHSYTAASLLSTQTEKIEETLWVCLRMFEERRNLLHSMMRGGGAKGTSAAARAEEAEEHIERIRAILLAKGAGEGVPELRTSPKSKAARRSGQRARRAKSKA